MKAKRLIFVVMSACAVLLFAGTSFAAVTRVGHLSMQNATETDFVDMSQSAAEKGSLKIVMSLSMNMRVPVFFDSLMAMQMALNAGEINEMSLPEAVAEYVMAVNDGYNVVALVRTTPVSLSFGFRKKDDPEMFNKFNEALKAMKADGTLAVLQEKYISAAGKDAPEAVKFEDFGKDAPVVKAAVTGDLPPIDYVGADGMPAGFNTAILAEIAKRLKINIHFVTVDSAARSASLMSGRSDVVFWFMSVNGFTKQLDVPDDIALSEPYYTWNHYLNLKPKDSK